ncbi:zinc finger protein 37-like isoform X24 [Periplaneta americana]|uniref:zinc finger protein 37-like isoform X24 n=1 Tax=Periplaneta americana TaxID=6978 RepID=UPI0037E8E8F6
MLYVERENSGHLPNGEQEGDTSEIMETSIMEGEEYYNQEGGEWTQKVDTGQLCRVCANPNDYLIPIFDGEGLEHELSMKIQKHLPIKVTETDTLPQHMCYQCASTLIAWHDLVISCVEADKKLRELQMEENDDDDDKGGEMFESPSLDSEMTDDVIQPSTSETQNQNQVSKTPSSKKAAVAKEKKSKLKMILVKGPPAGTSGQKTASKTQVAKALELAKSKDGVSQDSASERWQQISAYQQARYTTGNYVTMSQWYHCAGDDTKFYNRESNDVSKYYSKDPIEVTSCYERDPLEVPDFYKKDPLDITCPAGHSVKCFKQEEEAKHDSTKQDRLDDGRPIFQCDHCGKKLASRENMRVHLRIHTGERPFTCHICGKQFQAPSGIKRHLKEVHEGVKEHVCDICGRAFANKRTLEDHRRIHTGERPFVCDLCGKTFKTKASLYVHNKSHTDVFPFECPHCEKCFRAQTSLTLHILKHTGEKPHACDICGKRFRIKYELGKHRLIHSDGKPFVCMKCGHAFRLKKYLKNHNKFHHQDE